MSAYMNGSTPTHVKMTLPTTIAIKMENDTSNLDDDGNAEIYNGSLMLPVQMIKSEPPLDINDSCEQDTISNIANGDNNISMMMSEHLIESPKIRIKPTSKLMPCPNPTDPKRRFICPFDNCSKAYGKSSHLRSHLTWHTGIKPFVCKEPNCGRGFTRSDELNRHVRTHTGEKPFECVQCTKKFSRSDHLTKHLATHAKQMNGTTTKRATTNSPGNEQAQASQPQQQSQVESQGQVQSSNLQQQNQQRRQSQQTRQLEYSLHQERLQKMVQQKRLEERQQQQQQQEPQDPLQIHPQNTARTDADAETGATSDSNHLQFSVGMHFMAALISGNDPLAEGDSETDGKIDTSSFQIKEERPETNDNDFQMMPQTAHPHHQHHQQQLQRQYQLNERNAPAHINESEDDIPPELIMPVSTMICPLSPVGTRPHDPSDDQIMPEANAITLRKVENTQLDPERPFRCIHCEKSFKRADDLNRHVRTHTGEKPFACSECSRRFMRGDHLKKHMRTHTKAR